MAPLRTEEITDPAHSSNTSPILSPEAIAAPPQPFSRRFFCWATSPTPATNNLIEFFRTCLRIFLIMYQEFFRTHLAIRASALTYAIILSLVPILALSTSILKGLGNDEQLKLAAIKFIEQVEPPVTAQESPGASPGSTLNEQSFPSTGTLSVEQSQRLINTNLHRAVDIIFGYVERTNFAALGILGIIGLIGVVLLVLSTIENAMNAIWHTNKGRSLFRKLMDYLALLIVLPISMNIALAAEAILASKKIMSQISIIVPKALVVTFFIKLLPFGFIVFTLMILYLFFPHVKVKTVPALTGAVFAAIFWFFFQKMYIALQVGVASYNAIYGSFASIPLFLIWLQIGWTFILLGASLAYAIQNHHHYIFSGLPGSPQRNLQIAFDIIHTVYANFAERRATSLSELYEKLLQTKRADINAVATLLITGGLLRRDENTGEEAMIPATFAQNLQASEVVHLVLGNEILSTPGGELACRAVDAAGKAVQSNHFLTQFSSENTQRTPPAPK
jgi:membrane protein